MNALRWTAATAVILFGALTITRMAGGGIQDRCYGSDPLAKPKAIVVPCQNGRANFPDIPMPDLSRAKRLVQR